MTSVLQGMELLMWRWFACHFFSKEVTVTGMLCPEPSPGAKLSPVASVLLKLFFRFFFLSFLFYFILSWGILAFKAWWSALDGGHGFGVFRSDADLLFKLTSQETYCSAISALGLFHFWWAFLFSFLLMPTAFAPLLWVWSPKEKSLLIAVVSFSTDLLFYHLMGTCWTVPDTSAVLQFPWALAVQLRLSDASVCRAGTTEVIANVQTFILIHLLWVYSKNLLWDRKERRQQQHQDLPASAKQPGMESEMQWLNVILFSGDNTQSFQNKGQREILPKDIHLFLCFSFFLRVIQLGKCYRGFFGADILTLPTESPRDKNYLIISDQRMFFISKVSIYISGIHMTTATT